MVPSLAHYPVNSICSSYEPQGHIGFRQESVNKIQYEGGKTAGVWIKYKMLYIKDW